MNAKKENGKRVSRSQTFYLKCLQFKMRACACVSVCVCERWVYFLIYISLQNNLITSNLFPFFTMSIISVCTVCERKTNTRKCIKIFFLHVWNGIEQTVFSLHTDKHRRIHIFTNTSVLDVLRRLASGFQNRNHFQCTIKIRNIIIK